MKKNRAVLILRPKAKKCACDWRKMKMDIHYR